MRTGFGQFQQTSPEYLLFAQQFGATDILLNTPALPSYDGTWALVDLVNLRRHVETYGMKLSALENVPRQFYDHIILNGPKRDEQIDSMIPTVRNIARAGIPIFGYDWMPSKVWRTPPKSIRDWVAACRGTDSVHPAWESMGERLRRELQREVEG